MEQTNPTQHNIKEQSFINNCTGSNRDFEEKIVKLLLLAMALTSVLALALIGFFIFKEGMPIFLEYGLFNVIFGTTWNPTNQIYGIFPMIVGTILVTAVALIIGAPMGIAVAVFLAEIAPQKYAQIVRPAIELLAGIPSVVYGLFGMVVIREIISAVAKGPFGDILPAHYQTGYSVLAGGIILAIMILPTVINISEDAIRCVPKEYKEGAMALGASKWQNIYTVVVPAAKSGILAAIILGIGRALGETMAIIMVVGNTVLIPELGWEGLFAPVRSMTGNIALEMGYAGPEHRQALFATGIVLFVFIMFLNSLTMALAKRGNKR
ncbi:phosphate transport system permease protein [Desulfitispora alkaliphila]|uniref:phosphate ABC transporter permease subunit PstC n=1 Tax=Desulfitispora alkaliphila TaxID=622674 RepID=UPI003D1AB145